MNLNTANQIFSGSKSGISSTPVALSAFNYSLRQELTVYAPTTNVVTLYLGGSGGITTGTADSTSGFPLIPGGSIKIPMDNPANVYAVGVSGSNTLFWMGL